MCALLAYPQGSCVLQNLCNGVTGVVQWCSGHECSVLVNGSMIAQKRLAEGAHSAVPNEDKACTFSCPSFYPARGSEEGIPDVATLYQVFSDFRTVRKISVTQPVVFCYDRIKQRQTANFKSISVI